MEDSSPARKLLLLAVAVAVVTILNWNCPPFVAPGNGLLVSIVNFLSSFWGREIGITLVWVLPLCWQNQGSGNERWRELPESSFTIAMRQRAELRRKGLIPTRATAPAERELVHA